MISIIAVQRLRESFVSVPCICPTKRQKRVAIFSQPSQQQVCSSWYNLFAFYVCWAFLPFIWVFLMIYNHRLCVMVAKNWCVASLRNQIVCRCAGPFPLLPSPTHPPPLLLSWPFAQWLILVDSIECRTGNGGKLNNNWFEGLRWLSLASA